MPRPWTVLPHAPLEPLEENLWAVEGSLPRGAMRRRMTVVRLSDGRLVFHNAIPLDEASMARLGALGTPAFLVVPSRYHRLDLHAWKARFPGCAVLCPAPARKHVEAVVPVDGDLARLPADPALAWEALAGTRPEEPVLVARSPAGRASLVFGDAVMNLADVPGLGGAFLRLLGSSGGPRVTPLFRFLAVSDRAALAAHLARLASTPGLARLVPSHGAIVDRDPGAVLRGVGARLR